MAISNVSIVGSAVALLVAFSGAVAAQETAYGRSLFEQNCSVCHGVSGAGDGSVAELFTVKPKNLQRLAAENNGAFPFSETYQAIDGRRNIKGHGTSEMPIWGGLFEAELMPKTFHPSIEPEELVQARILALVYYIQSMQE